MQFKEIPRKLIVAKRLAQCLNPALPTGVHQRALDVYSHILAVLGVSSHSYIRRRRVEIFFVTAGRSARRSRSMVIRVIFILRIRRYICQGEKEGRDLLCVKILTALLSQLY